MPAVVVGCGGWEVKGESGRKGRERSGLGVAPCVAPLSIGKSSRIKRKREGAV